MKYDVWICLELTKKHCSSCALVYNLIMDWKLWGMSSIEKVYMFLYTLSLTESNRTVGEHFQHSREMVSRCFTDVLPAVLLLIRTHDLNFRDISLEILYDNRYMPLFIILIILIVL